MKCREKYILLVGLSIPFLSGTNRADTDETRLGKKIDVEGILGTGFNLGYSYMDVDDDLIGAKNTPLRRAGTAHNFVAGYAIQWGESNSLTPQLKYEVGDLDGKSNSFDSFCGGLTHTYSSPTLAWLSSSKYGEEPHSVADKVTA